SAWTWNGIARWTSRGPLSAATGSGWTSSAVPFASSASADAATGGGPVAAALAARPTRPSETPRQAQEGALSLEILGRLRDTGHARGAGPLVDKRRLLVEQVAHPQRRRPVVALVGERQVVVPDRIAEVLVDAGAIGAVVHRSAENHARLVRLVARDQPGD